MSSKDGFNRTIPRDDRQRRHYSAVKIVIQKSSMMLSILQAAAARSSSPLWRGVLRAAGFQYHRMFIFLRLLGYLGEEVVVERGGT